MLIGTPRPDVIHGMGGNDTIYGLAGIDAIGGPATARRFMSPMSTFSKTHRESVGFMQTDGRNIIGVAQLSQLKARDGWLLSYLMHTSEAPHGTPKPF